MGVGGDGGDGVREVEGKIERVRGGARGERERDQHFSKATRRLAVQPQRGLREFLVISGRDEREREGEAHKAWVAWRVAESFWQICGLARVRHTSSFSELTR